MYDDVRNTKNSLNHWVEETEANLTEEDEEKVRYIFLVKSIYKCLQTFFFQTHYVLFFFKIWPNQWQSGNVRNWKTGNARFKPRSRLST